MLACYVWLKEKGGNSAVMKMRTGRHALYFIKSKNVWSLIKSLHVLNSRLLSVFLFVKT